MTMDANLVVSRREAALLVPNRALKGNLVWVVEQDRLHRREVSKGVTGTDRTEILSGLQRRRGGGALARRQAARGAARACRAGASRCVRDAVKPWRSHLTLRWLT